MVGYILNERAKSEKPTLGGSMQGLGGFKTFSKQMHNGSKTTIARPIIAIHMR